MGYSTTFRLKGELDDKFKTWTTSYKKSDEKKYKVILDAVCMKAYDGFEGRDTWVLYKIYDKVHSAVQFYVKLLVENWKYCIGKTLKEHNNEINFFGWEYSGDRDCPWESEEDLVDHFTEDLFMLAINESNKPFGGKRNEDDEEWYEKWEKVNSITRDIDECVVSLMDNQFIDRYRDSEDADEDDGGSHRFPEDVDDEDEEETDDEEYIDYVHPIDDNKDESGESDDENDDAEAERIREEINKNLDETAKKLEMRKIATEEDPAKPVTYSSDDSSNALEVKLPNNGSINASGKPSKLAKNTKNYDGGE